MKTIQRFGLSIILLVASMVTGTSAIIKNVSLKESEPIVISPYPANPIGAPRAPEVIPFFAELLNGYVILGASAPCGTVSVSLTSTAGDSYSTNFDTSDGAILLPVSGDAGFYTIRITTSAGVQYVGEFTI